MDNDNEADPKYQTQSSSDLETAGSLRPSPCLSPSVQAQLGQRLRHFYESLALGETPVPERFIDLINRLEQMNAEEKPL